MSNDPFAAGAALAELVSAQSRLDEATRERGRALTRALVAGNNLREVADVTQCSHESVRRLSERVVFTFNGMFYPLSEAQTEMLMDKLAGYAQGKYPNDIAKYIGGDASWLPAARDVARVLYAFRLDLDASPISLDEEHGRAVHLVLKISYKGNPSHVARLFEDLDDHYGKVGK